MMDMTIREQYEGAYCLVRTIRKLQMEDCNDDEIAFCYSWLDVLDKNAVKNAKQSYEYRGVYDRLAQPLVIRQIRRRLEPMYSLRSASRLG